VARVTNVRRRAAARQAARQAAREYDDEQERLASAERAPDVVEAAAGIVASRAVGQDRIAAAGIRDRLGAGDGGNMTIRAGTAGATGGRVALGKSADPPPASATSPIGGVDRTKPRRLFRFMDEEQDDG
jgi:hypothetical protein